MFQAATKSKIDTYLYVMVIAIAFLLIMRNMGLYPVVFADEYTYSRYARLIPFEKAAIPGYLYFSIYKITSLCGDGFLGCARILNVLFFVSSAPFIYLIARKLAGRKTALLIAALSILGPQNSYTAYFMPESPYFLFFWLFTYLVLSIKKEHAVSYWLFMGVIFGLCALIKPHALFIVPAIGIYFFIIQRRKFIKGDSNSFLYGQYFGFFASAISTKLIIGFAMAGVSGITFFGTTYTSMASESMDVGQYISLIKRAFQSLQGHFLTLSLLFSVPIGQLLLTLKLSLRRDLEQYISINIALYTSLILVFLLIVVAFFTASIFHSQLHMRYYNFAFPLLLLVAVSPLSMDAISSSIKHRAIIGFPIGAAICYAIHTRLASYASNFVDGPELRGFTFSTPLFYVLSGVSILSLALWVYSARSGTKVFMYLFMPLAVGFSTFHINQDLKRRLVPDVFDKAGIFTKQYFSNEDISKVVIVGSSEAGLYKTLFHIDNPRILPLQRISNDTTIYDPSKFPDHEWFLIIGNYSLPDNTFYQLPMNGFTLARRLGSTTP